MNYNEKIKKELLNDKVWKNLYAAIKPEERESVDKVVDELINLANSAVMNFSVNTAQSDISLEEIESAVKDRTGRK